MEFEDLKNLLRLASKLGLKDWSRHLFKSLVEYQILRFIFGFDQWHVWATYEARPYKQVVVETANELQSVVVVEIGCGLGEIISRVDSVIRCGIDSDGGAIRAARILNRQKHILFIPGGFQVAKSLPFGHIDSLIMVNWLHSIPPEVLRSELDEMTNRVEVRYIIADEILSESKGYRYHHDLAKTLNGLFNLSKTVGDAEGVRRLVVLKSVTN